MLINHTADPLGFGFRGVIDEEVKNAP